VIGDPRLEGSRCQHPFFAKIKSGVERLSERETGAELDWISPSSRFSQDRQPDQMASKEISQLLSGYVKHRGMER